MRRWWIVILVLTSLAVVAALTQRSSGPPSTVPSVTNPGPQGLKALANYLRETGHPIQDSIDHAHTVVLAEPRATLREEELSPLRRLVDRGGRFVYLAGDHPQGPLEEWLELSEGDTLPAASLLANPSDPGSAMATVRGVPGVKQLRLVTAHGVTSFDGLVLAEAGGIPVAIYQQRGKGEVWIFPNASIAQNARIAEADNLALWEKLASGGPVAFDERHLVPPASSSLPIGFAVVGAQLLLIAAVFFYGTGKRFGPPRPELTTRHRSSMEYVSSLAALAQGAHLEGELLRRARERLERIVSADDEALQALSEEIKRAERAGVRPGEYLRLTQELARMEGRAGTARHRANE